MNVQNKTVFDPYQPTTSVKSYNEEIAQKISELVTEQVKLFQAFNPIDVIEDILPQELSSVSFFHSLWGRGKESIDKLSSDDQADLTEQVKELAYLQAVEQDSSQLLADVIEREEISSNHLIDLFFVNYDNSLDEEDLSRFIDLLALPYESIKEKLLQKLSRILYQENDEEFEALVLSSINEAIRERREEITHELAAKNYLSSLPAEKLTVSVTDMPPCVRFTWNVFSSKSTFILSCRISENRLQEALTILQRQDRSHPLRIVVDLSNTELLKRLIEQTELNLADRVVALSSLDSTASSPFLPSFLLQLPHLRTLELENMVLAPEVLQALSSLQELQTLSLRKSTFNAALLTSLTAEKIDLSGCRGEGVLRFSTEQKAIIDLTGTKFDYTKLRADGHIVMHEDFDTSKIRYR